MMNQNTIHRIGNSLGLAIVCVILLITFIEQFFQHDLPCPLCLLQRVSFVAIGLCIAMNLQYGIKISHYGLMILSALLGFSISLWQVFLHTAPADPGYGHALLGFHLYVWSSIAFMIIIGFIAIAILIEHGFTEPQQKTNRAIRVLMVFFVILILANGISTFIECGFAVCPADPVRYILLSS